MSSWKNSEQLDLSRVNQARDALDQVLKRFIESGDGQEALVGAARSLQEGLACARHNQYPCAHALGLIMRAVIAVLEGDHDEGHRQYIYSKLDLGVTLLEGGLRRPT